MALPRQRYALAFTATVVALFIALAIAGGVIHYSPVPYMDMWDSYLNFYVSLGNGRWLAWWDQHNEHRIVLARLLFWMDLAWFHGRGIFLLMMNYVFAGLSATLFYVYLSEQLPGAAHQQFRRLLGLFILASLYAWCQSENLTWGFQSQFFLSQLLPLAVFYCIHKSASDSARSFGWYVAACFLGVAAVGTMANGVLALPLACLLALILGLGKRKAAFLALLSIAGITIYFYDFIAASHHGSLRDAILNEPIRLFRYVLIYIGSPFYYFFAGGKLGKNMAEFAGFILVASSVVFCIRAIRARSMPSLSLALLTFILYVGGTAFGTGGGRLVLGLHQAVASRYTTPALMAWAALLILYAPFLAVRLERWGKKSLVLGLLAAALMFPLQLTALQPFDELFDRQVAALALELRVKDDTQLKRLYPRPHVIMDTSAVAVEQDLSIFGLEPIKNVSKLIGTKQPMKTTSVCKGNIDRVSDISPDSRYVRIEGSVLDEDGRGVEGPVHIMNAANTIVGYALTEPHQSGAGANAENLPLNQFKGYLLAEYEGEQITLASVASACAVSLTTPQALYYVGPSGLAIDSVTVGQESVIDNKGWQGKDYQQTSAAGLVVLGSFIQSDADRGSLSLALKRGDKLLYRSGPGADRQRLELSHHKESSIALPVADEWTLLDFSVAHLPDTFTVTFIDAGDGWGEWSAIAVKE
ncbi:hypothetical protein EKL30_09890 [Candidimonas sp. SYP-B2681]|uniref:hypothetical protein n=1 Tax=Candidimonas sp. SYP-B2681 TaxID=2497686 RepID=UPI000F87095A|nr:hypothetical protein [Candidimonas sp. SYP-B2681]RTZ43186.1 hypothetical protein EKL30_09890 [Candidimonas sp. SYP-B2681]